MSVVNGFVQSVKTNRSTNGEGLSMKTVYIFFSKWHLSIKPFGFGRITQADLERANNVETYRAITQFIG